MLNYNPWSVGRDAWLKKDVGDVGGSPPSIPQKAVRTAWWSSLMLVLCLLAGIDIQAQVSINETFEGASTPTGWTYTSFARNTTTPCAGTASIRKNQWASATTGNAATPTWTSNGNDVSIQFNYKLINFTGGAATPNSPAWGSIITEVSTNGGSSYTIVAGTIDATNHVPSASCATMNYTVLGAQVPAGNTIRVRFRLTFASGDYYVYLDDVIITQNSTTPPNCATGLAPADLATTARNPVLTWTAATGVPTSYDVYFGTSSTPPLVATVTGTSYTPVAPLLPTTTYYWQIVPKNINGPATGCITNSFTTTADLNYCLPTISNGCVDGDVIARVVLNTLDNNSGAGCPGGLSGYSNYTTNPALTTTLQAGASYSITIYAGQYPEAYAAWIDYNDNGVFETPSERVGFSPGLIAGSGVVGQVGSSASFPIAIACNPPIGQHRLRVRAQYDAGGVEATSGSQVTPCGNNLYGEVEDYLITISAPEACPQPFGLAATGTSNTGGTLSWSVGCAETAWEVAVQPIGSGIPTGAGTPVSGTPTHIVSGLPSGGYEFYVRADCQGDGYSLWTGPYIFTPPTCPALISPANGATNVAMPGGGVPIIWSATPGATSYDVYFGQTSGATVNLGTIAGTTVNITGVVPGSTNFWMIVANGEHGESLGCTEFSFTTAACTAQSVPYSQGFESIGFANVLADCVTSTPPPSAGGKVQTFVADASATNPALTARTGTKFAAVYWSPSGKGTIYSPGLQLTAGVGYRVSVYYKTDGEAWSNVGLYWGTEATAAAMTNTIAAVAGAAATEYTEITGDFVAPATGTFYIAMQADNTTSSLENYCAFDDFSVSIAPTIISSFTPASACANVSQFVTLTGAGFTGATSVQVNGVEVPWFSVIDNNTLELATPLDFTTGYITVDSPTGLGTSATELVANPAPPISPITTPGGVTNVCIPETLQFSNATPTGAWASLDLDVATIDVNSGLLTPVAAGFVVITYTTTNELTGCSSVESFGLVVADPVNIVSSTPTQSVVTGGDTSFTVVATGTGSPSLNYQWYVCTDGSGVNFDAVVDGANYSGSATATLQVLDAPIEFNGYFFQCTVNGTCNTPISDLAVLLVGETGFDDQPDDANVCDAGAGIAQFSVVASPDVTSYLWYEDQGGDNWLPLSNAGMYDGVDTATLTLSGVTLANSGWRYKVQITGIGFAESNPATLTVFQSISINTPPAAQSVCYTGGASAFSVAATGGIAGYQWQYSSDNGTSWNNVVAGTPLGATYTGATSPNLTVNTTNATPAGNHAYRALVLASAPCVDVPSAGAQLVINAPAITGQPVAASVLAGGSTSFTVTTSASAPIYQWQYATAVGGPYNNVVNNTPAGVTYTGADTATLGVATTSAALASTARYYRAVVSSPAGCSVNSNGAQLTIINYCTPSYGSGTGFGDYISRVTIPTTTLNNVTTGAATPYFTLYPQAGSTTATVYKGETYTLSVAGGTYSTCYVSAWADYNGDGDFADAGEFIGVSPNCGAQAVVNLTTSWLIPNTAVTGSVRIRLRSSDTSPGPTAGQSCGATNSGYGEAEDYILTVAVPPACEGTPAAATIAASSESVCISGSVVLTASGYPVGYTGISFQWYNSQGPINLATGTTYTTPVLSAPETYYFRVNCANGGGFADSNEITINVNNPSVTDVTPGSRCGTGSVVLEATGSAGTTLNWFASETGGAPIATGETFNTPTISDDTTYYVAASIGGTASTIGKPSSTGVDGSFVFTSYGVVLSAALPYTLNSTVIYPVGTGTVTIALYNSSGTELASTAAIPVSGTGVATPVTIPLGFAVPPGTGYRLLVKAYTGLTGIIRDFSGVTYPYGNASGAVTGGWTGGASTTYYFFYNMSITTGCFSARTAVTATVETPPALTLSDDADSICQGTSTVTPVTITSNVADYDSYVWTPNTNVSGTPASGYTFNPSGTVEYTLTATNTSTGCANTATFTVTVNPTPAAIVFSPNAPSVCSEGTPVLINNFTGTLAGNTGGCLEASQGQYPTGPAYSAGVCNGTMVNSVTTAAWAGEYSLVAVSADTKYTFTSTGAGDYVTISDADGTTVLAAGPSPITWISSSAAEVRFYTHTDSACGEESLSRTRSFVCEPVAPAAVYSPTTGLFTDAAGTIAYNGAPTRTVYAKPTETQIYSVTTTSGAGCSVNAQVTVTVIQATTWYVDADGDGYGNDALPTQLACEQPVGYAALSGDCNDEVAAIHPNAVEVPFNGVDDDCDGDIDETGTVTTTLLGSSCGVTLASINSLVGIQTVGGHPITGYRIRMTNGSEVQVIERDVPHFIIPQFPSHAYATTYSIDIQLQRAGIWQASWGTPCLVSTPAILADGGAGSVNPSQCGITLASINTLIATTSLQGVTGYRFRVTNLTDPLGPNAVQTIDRTQNWFSLQMLTRYNYGTQYRIEVAVKTTGTFGGYGAPCELSSPAVPTLVNCNATIAAKHTPIASSSVSGATQYRFQVVRASDNASATIDRSTNFFNFNMIPAASYTAGGLYYVRVAVMTSGTWSPFGDACEITAPGAGAKGLPTA
ncbi:Putative metal-binding motif-containing protein, partial [Flavobacterium caeni]